MAWDNAVKWTRAGLDAIHVAYRNSTTGHFAGFSNLSTASTPDTGSGARRLFAAQTAPTTIPAKVAKTIQGDDVAFDSYLFGSAEVATGQLEFGQVDGAFKDAAEGTSSKAVGIYTMYGSGDSIANPGAFMFLLTRQAKENGVGGFETEVVLSTRVDPIGDEDRAFQKEGKDRYTVTFNNSLYTPWGETCTSAFGVSTRKSILIPSQYRLMFHIWIADGTEVETTALDYTPTTAAQTKAYNATTGGALTVSSINTSTKTVTLNAAPASGVPVVIWYQTASF